MRLAVAVAALLLAPVASAADAWWRDAVGAAELTPPGPGVPITMIDTGLDLSHPGFTARPWTTALNAQTVLGGREGHGTAVASVIGLGLYPQALLLSWDASPTGFFTNAGIVSGLQAAPAPGVANLSLGSDRRSARAERRRQRRDDDRARLARRAHRRCRGRRRRLPRRARGGCAASG